MVAIPITNDQPGVASRLEWLGVAEVVAPSRLSVPRLAAAIERVLREPAYREESAPLPAGDRPFKWSGTGSGYCRSGDLAAKASAARPSVSRTSGANVWSGRDPRSLFIVLVLVIVLVLDLRWLPVKAGITSEVAPKVGLNLRSGALRGEDEHEHDWSKKPSQSTLRTS
jgi:hypothetical protein